MKLTLTLVLLLVINSTSKAQRHDHPSHYLKSVSNKLMVFLEAADFQPGESIADIGAGNGWFDAAIGIYEDSLNFVLEEIDSSFVKESRLNEAVIAYAAVKGRPITCHYTQVIGTQKSTQLPDKKFDKVILIDTYHHLQHRDEMIEDIKRILRPGGKLIIYEPVGKKNGEIFKPCHSMIYTSEEIISSFVHKGLRFERSLVGGKTARKRTLVFVFSRHE
jgi:ubiquinone/menaquinone biosynthesis C-methylase UbiE